MVDFESMLKDKVPRKSDAIKIKILSKFANLFTKFFSPPSPIVNVDFVCERVMDLQVETY
ncbi:MAG: hypothetical protein QXL52_03430 [Nitrososphaerales archaeon]